MADTIDELRDATEAMALATDDVARIARRRAALVAQLQAEGWSLGKIAAELGVSKSAVAQMRR